MKKRLYFLLVAAILAVLTGCNGTTLPAASPVESTATPQPPTSAPAKSTVAPPTLAPPTATTPAQAQAPTATSNTDQASGGGGQGTQPTATSPTDEASATATADDTSIPPEGTPVLTDPLAIELRATVVAEFPATPTPASVSDIGGIEGVNVIPITATASMKDLGTLWAVYSYGQRRFDPEENHFVSIYSHNNGAWKRLSLAKLDNPDIIDPTGVDQVNVEPGNVWIEVQSGVGAHGGCFDLLRFDGQVLRDEVQNCSSTPNGGGLEDLNGDGKLDAILNQSEDYVFCYACGVSYIHSGVMTWNGTKMQPVNPQSLPDTAPQELRTMVDRAINLAQHDLWKDALQTITDTLKFNSQDPTYIWDAALIKLDGEARQEHANNSGFPLLTNVFYGDYDTALNILRGHTPEQIFDLNSDLYKDTPAPDWQEALTDYMTRTTTLAIQAEPNLAGAYFLRGWAYSLADPKDPRVLADIEKAATLAPSDKLLSDSLAYVRKKK